MGAKVVSLFLLMCPIGWSGAAGGPGSHYTQAARRYAEALLRYGRDHYGKIQTPLWAHMLDLRTLEIPRQRTAAEWRAEMAGWKEDRNYLLWGKDRSSVAWAEDSNLLWDTESIRLFYAISKDTGDARFADAADQYVKYFLRCAVSRTTGLFAWGEHIAYNLVEDKVIGKRHELQHTDPPWEELWRFDPDRVRNEIEGVYQYHVTDHREIAYDRHANYWNGLPERDQATILLYNGTYITAWGFLYRKTGDPKYLDWARRQVLAFQSKANGEGLWPDNWTDTQKRELPLNYPVRTELAAALYRMYDLTGDKAWLDDADRYLAACEGRVDVRARDGQAFPAALRADFAEAALRRYRSTGNRATLVQAEAMGEFILTNAQPRAQMASHLAEQLNFLMTLYGGTGEARWLAGARQLGDYAIRVFLHPSGLIRGTAVVDRPDYYDAIQGPGALAWALYRLGQLDGVSAPAPVTAGRMTRPEIRVVSAPAVQSNREVVQVVTQIAAVSGVQRATLHYAYGNQVGFRDDAPTVAGDTYTFRIQPAGLAFLGEAAFAVEAVDGEGNRALTPWRRVKLVAEENGVRTSAWPPAGVGAPEAGWRSVGRYFEVAARPASGRLLARYAPEETWRLIESTLTLAYWDGARWVRAASDLNRARRTVTAPWRAARVWTLLGEDRVLWRADGRETGPTLADLDGDGKLEVITTLYQPGELLTAQGTPVRQFPMDRPYHPVNNSSSPAVAQLAAGEEAALLFVSPSGYLYAYQKSGRLRWRAELGGEALGAPAVGALLAGGARAVAVAWGGGVSVFDAVGRRVWERRLPVAAASTPVLVDLDGDGRLEVVASAGSKVVALEGNSGRIIWEYQVENTEFTVPSAGEFIRGGKPRVVVGDGRGVIHAIDERGRLLWRQDRIFGPREVPEPVEYYSGIAEVGLADLDGRGERQVIATTRAGETVALGARGERLWRFASYERKTGISLNGGARLAFADLDNDGQLEVVLSQQDSFVYVLGADGREKWSFQGYFWYHNAPAVGDLLGNGELNVVFTGPENRGTFALRSGVKGKPGCAPWPMMRGGLARTNCASWR
jgi:outer membrane protein assembly factor BamB